jgi:hypothetical protein
VATLAAVAASALITTIASSVWYTLRLRDHNEVLQGALSRAESGIQIKMAQALVGNDPAGLLGNLLNRLRPPEQQVDFRGFEWHHLWRLARADFRLHGQHSPVYSVAIAPDGVLCASGGFDGLVCLWETQTGRQVASWQTHSKIVNTLQFTPEGSELVSGGSDGKLSVWQVATGTELVRRGDGSSTFRSLALHPDGSAIAFALKEASGANSVGLWNWRTGKTDLLPHDPAAGNFWKIRFSPNGRKLAAACDGQVILGSCVQRADAASANEETFAHDTSAGALCAWTFARWKRTDLRFSAVNLCTCLFARWKSSGLREPRRDLLPLGYGQLPTSVNRKGK